MPVRHALSAKRGLPPLGLALATGINGSTSSHNRSGKSSVAIGQLPSVGMVQPFRRVAGEMRFCSKSRRPYVHTPLLTNSATNCCYE
jgi:hypothetical protein